MDPIPPPDLEIRVTVETRGGETFLTYLLHSSSDRQTGFHYQVIHGKPLRTQPQDYHTALLEEIERLSAGKHLDGSLVLEEEVAIDLEALGRKLYRELFPPEMRAAYRTFRKTVTTILITSDEPWIPWELVKPYEDDAGELIDDDFLCVRFQLTRWLSGSLGPATVVGIEESSCIESGRAVKGSRLPNAELELKWLRNLAGRHPKVDDRSLPGASYPEVRQRLEEGSSDLLHFVGHGRFESGDPDQSSFYLIDGRHLRPLDLHGKIQTQTKIRRPLVFLNACQVGRQSFSLTGLGGWAPRWVKGCGCGAFIAPLWPVNDRLAHIFATTFYHALEKGGTFGEATQTARLRVQEFDSSKPTWLAYAVYSHPNGRLLFGQKPQLATEESNRSAVAGSTEKTLVSYPGVASRRDRSGQRHDRRRQLLTGGLIVVVSLTILIALSQFLGIVTKPLLDEKVGMASPATSSEEALISKDREDTLAPSEPPLESSEGVPPQPQPIKTVEEPRVSSESPSTALPLQRLIPGRIGIMVLDSTTRRPDSEIAEAVASMLSSIGNRTQQTTPEFETQLIERLIGGDYSILPEDGRTPWGTEYLLVATANSKKLPQSNSALESVALTIHAHLIATNDKTIKSRSGATHTGIGVSRQQALTQAAERCLKDVITFLEGAEKDENSN